MEDVNPNRLDEIADAVIEGGLIRAVFQPILDLRTGRTAGLEALSRPIGVAEGVNPAELFSPRIGDRARAEIEHLARWESLRRAGEFLEPFQLLFMNVSAGTLLMPGEIDRLRELVARNPAIEPRRIVLEITEDPERVDEAALATTAETLQAHGFMVALDDVGVGGNGLGRVSRIRPDWVKLDRKLVSGIDTDEERRRLVSFLIRLAGEIGAKVVAEGIETVDELAAVIRLGATHAQGYGLGRPEARPAGTSREIIEVVRGAGVAHGIAGRRHPLTGLPDRIAIEQRIRSELERSGGGDHEIAVVDLRDLHRLNARRGYEQGDRAIERLGRELSEIGFGRVRFVGHAGDDRFVVMGAPGAVESVIEEAASVLMDAGLASVRGLVFEGLLPTLNDPSDLFHLHSAVKGRADARIEPEKATIRIPMAPSQAAA
ncbi:MAG: EAL domain-containing protein [Phycisphaerales bacterium JB040]